jgi:hypothetical protein
MTISGWFFFIFSWLVIIGMNIYCLKKVFSKKELK